MLACSLEPTECAARLLDLLPGTVSVRDPAVAALAAHFDPELTGDGASYSDRAGDSVVCRMMANTVLVSTIRA